MFSMPLSLLQAVKSDTLGNIFCDADNMTYSGLKKMAFSRTKALGYDADCCDFRFSRK